MPSHGCSMNAGAGGHLPVLQWLQEQSRLVPSTAMHGACQATGNRLEVLEWLVRTTGVKPDRVCCRMAAYSGSISTLQFLLDHGAPLDHVTCESAVRNGQLPTAQWLFEHGFPLSRECCPCAASGGDLLALRWLREVGCAEWQPPRVISNAALGGHVHVLEYVREQGPFSWGTADETRSMLTLAARLGQVASLKWLLQNGCPFFDWRALLQATKRALQLSLRDTKVKLAEVLHWIRSQKGETWYELADAEALDSASVSDDETGTDTDSPDDDEEEQQPP
jgi:hypothetical protein